MEVAIIYQRFGYKPDDFEGEKVLPIALHIRSHYQLMHFTEFNSAQGHARKWFQFQNIYCIFIIAKHYKAKFS